MKKHISIILVVVLLATALVGCGSSDAGLTDGTYTGEAQGMAPLKVSVTVTDGKIADVEVTEQEETPGFSEPALEQIPDAIVEKNSTEVDAVSGATVTSNAIKEAVNNALEQAK
ncbi:MAG: FMN-binding protein [Tissierella sp.]|nr:FMN-binding protein [Tissierella sp.]